MMIFDFDVPYSMISKISAIMMAVSKLFNSKRNLGGEMINNQSKTQ